jgi:hypothetical protein
VDLSSNPQSMISFDDLSDNEKAKIIWYKGEFITSVFSNDTKFNLFSLHGSFVEIRFHLDTDEVRSISVLNENELERYLEKVTIRGVLS